MPDVEYTIRKKFFTVLTKKFHIFDANEKLLGYSEQKAFKLKEDIRIYTDETKTDERLAIKARSIVDFSAAYDVYNSKDQRKVGALKRKGWSSIVRDSWTVMDADDQEVGMIQEDSMTLALIRRFLPLGGLIPQKYHLSDASGTELASFPLPWVPIQLTFSPTKPNVVFTANLNGTVTIFDFARFMNRA